VVAQDETSVMLAKMFGPGSPLTDRESRVLRLRFGIGLSEPMKVLDAAAELNVSAARVYELERNAIAKLARKLGGRPHGAAR
jgi:DNA-directed RNA polymerase sigma subunit (sigma70/sigma32)